MARMMMLRRYGIWCGIVLCTFSFVLLCACERRDHSSAACLRLSDFFFVRCADADAFSFFPNGAATTESGTLSPHDARGGWGALYDTSSCVEGGGLIETPSSVEGGDVLEPHLGRGGGGMKTSRRLEGEGGSDDNTRRSRGEDSIDHCRRHSREEE